MLSSLLAETQHCQLQALWWISSPGSGHDARCGVYIVKPFSVRKHMYSWTSLLSSYFTIYGRLYLWTKRPSGKLLNMLTAQHFKPPRYWPSEFNSRFGITMSKDKAELQWADEDFFDPPHETLVLIVFVFPMLYNMQQTFSCLVLSLACSQNREYLQIQ